MDALERELLAVFEGEFQGHVRAVRGVLAREGIDQAALREVFRRIHSLKGAARAVGRRELEALAHGLETVLQEMLRREVVVGAAERAGISGRLDAIEALGVVAAGEEDGGREPDAGGGEEERYVQVPQSRLEGFAAGLRALSAAIEAQERAWGELEAVFPVRGRVPSGVEGRKLRALAAIRRNRDLSANRLSVALERLQADVRFAALVRVGDVFGPCAAMVRRLGQELGHEGGIGIRLDGMELEADRHSVQALRDPVLQVLRNGLAHGVEAPAVRARAGKPGVLRIVVAVRVEGGCLVVSVRDDGCGPDLAAIEARGRGLGMIGAGEVTRERVLACVFEAGFSTRRVVDDLAGRGFGLSIVADAVRRLGGGVEMREGGVWEEGVPCGTEVVMRVPLPRRPRNLLLVQAAGQSVGIDGGAVVRLFRARGGDFVRVGGRDCLMLPAETREAVPLERLGVLIGGHAAAVMPEEGWLAVCVRHGEAMRVLIVDRIVDAGVFLVEDARVPGLDVGLVPEICWPFEDRPALVLSLEGVFGRVVVGKHVLVVDDSATIREGVRAALRGAGYEVTVVADGCAALDILRRVRFDCVVSDLEMPCLDGIGLLAAMAGDEALACVPVVVMTGRDGENRLGLGPVAGARAVIAKREGAQDVVVATLGRIFGGRA